MVVSFRFRRIWLTAGWADVSTPYVSYHRLNQSPTLPSWFYHEMNNCLIFFVMQTFCMCDEISSSRCLVPSVWKSLAVWATFPWMFQENFVCMKTHMNSWAEVWIAWLQALASNMWSTSAQKWRPGLCCWRGMLSLCKFAWVIWFLSPVSFEPTLIHPWTALLMQSKPLLWFEANAARTGQYGCSFFAEPTIWSCSREKKKGFPELCCSLHLHLSLPPSLLHSVTHHWRILTKPHELLFRLSSLCLSLSCCFLLSYSWCSSLLVWV